jgi:hypothetical protein
MVEMIIMLMTRTSPVRSEARRRLTEGLLWGWHGYFPSFLGWKDVLQHERRPNSCIGMTKAESSIIIRKMASLGTPQMQRNGVTLKDRYREPERGEWMGADKNSSRRRWRLQQDEHDFQHTSPTHYPS